MTCATVKRRRKGGTKQKCRFPSAGGSGGPKNYPNNVKCGGVDDMVDQKSFKGKWDLHGGMSVVTKGAVWHPISFGRTTLALGISRSVCSAASNFKACDTYKTVVCLKCDKY